MQAGIALPRLIGIQAEPPIFADALPQALRALGAYSARLIAVERRDDAAEQAPFAQRDLDGRAARERLVSRPPLARELRHMAVGRGASGERRRKRGDEDETAQYWKTRSHHRARLGETTVARYSSCPAKYAA